MFTQLKAQYEYDTLPKTEVFGWAKKFKGGVEDVANASHIQCHRSSLGSALRDVFIFLDNSCPHI